MIDAKVIVRGMPEVTAALHATVRDLPEEAARDLAPVVQDIVGVARGKLPSVTGRAQTGIQAEGSTITFGGVDYEPWLDFGGSVGRRHGIHRPFVQGGRAVYPAIGQSGKRITDTVGDAFLDAARHHGFDVTR